MADISIGRSPSTGQVFARLPGGAVQEITESQAAEFESGNGAVTNALKSALNATQQLGVGASLLLPDMGKNAYNEGQLNALREDQMPRNVRSPVSSAPMQRAVRAVPASSSKHAAQAPL